MGICVSVAVWKEKVVYAAHGRRAGRRLGGVVAVTDGVQEGCGAGAGAGARGCEYGLLGGGDAAYDGALEAAASSAAKVVNHGAEVAGGCRTPPPAPARPIWQRRVLMGVKCQLPRFSGMILYDERGRPVSSGARDRARDQEKHAAAVMVLRDML